MNHILILVRIASEWHKELDPNAGCYLHHFQFFDKIDSFQKKKKKKNLNCIFEELSNLYLIVLFLFFCGLQQKIIEAIIYLNYKIKWNRTQYTA